MPTLSTLEKPLSRHYPASARQRNISRLWVLAWHPGSGLATSKL